jgi:hypothetical protein
MTAPSTVIPFARDVAMVNGNCSSKANYATHAMTAMKMRVGVFDCRPIIRPAFRPEEQQ